MSSKRNWFSDRQHSERQVRREALARKKKRHGLTRMLRVEKLEERVVMNADIYTDFIRVVAVGADAKWEPNSAGTCKLHNAVNNEYAREGTCVTSGLVRLTTKNGAGTGGGGDIDSPYGGTHSDATGSQVFSPKDGLIKIDNGQDVTFRENRATHAQQQELNFSGTANFYLKWNGQQTTRLLKVGDSAEVIQNALNSLSNIGGVGGSVTVTGSTDGKTYNVLFGGTTWFRPAFISIERLQIAERQRATVKGISQVAITKKNENSSLPISLSNNIQLRLPDDAISFPIDNAPSFTPTNLLRKDGSIRMLGSLEAPGIGGRYYPSGEGKSYDDANVEISSSGLRVRGSDWAYTLQPITDSTGKSRPITLFKLGGLSFEAPSGSTAKLFAKNGDANDLYFEALGENILVTAPFDGGKLSLRLSNTGNSPNFPNNVPIYTASLRTGKVTLTPKIEFESFEIGGW